MFAPAMPIDEPARQAAVDQLRLTDLEIEAAFDRIAQLLASLLDVPISVFTVIDRDRVFLRALTGLSDREVPRELSFCSHTILQDNLVIIPDARLDERYCDHPFVTGPPHLVFYASVPVRAPNGQPIGTLCAIDTRVRQLTPLMRQALVTLGAVLEDELRLRLLSTVDHLTGLFNRRQFDDVIEREWRRALRLDQPISLLTLDIDHFKLFNDRYGHLAGDQCLRLISGVFLDECSRSGDQAFRTGGEEFAVVLPGTDEAGATVMAQRLRDAIRGLAIPHQDSAQGLVTLSIGMTSVVPASRAIADFVRCADRALYAAKNQGRDCIVAKRFEGNRY